MNELSLYRCLSSATRLAVLQQLRGAVELPVKALAEATGTERTNLSHQLKELRACGLVACRQEGKQVYYRIAHTGLESLLDAAAELAGHLECADDAAGCC